MMSADDAGASLSFHEGKPSPLAVEIQRWATVNARYKHGQQKIAGALKAPWSCPQHANGPTCETV